MCFAASQHWWDAFRWDTDEFLIIVVYLNVTVKKQNERIGARDFTDIITQDNANLK